MQFFLGTYYHQLDGKNRIRIPAKLRKALGDEYFFAKGTDGCLIVYSREELEKKIETLKDIKLSDTERIRGQREFTRFIVAAEEDNQGRVVLDKVLKRTAKIEKDIVFIGTGDRIELWAKEVYDNYFGDNDDDYDMHIKNSDL